MRYTTLAVLMLAACTQANPDQYKATGLQPVSGESNGVFYDATNDRVSVFINDAEVAYITSAGNIVPDGTITSTGAFTATSTSAFNGAATFSSGLTAAVSSTNTINNLAQTKTAIDFTAQPQAIFVAKTTGAIMTEIDTQEDVFYTGFPPKYFELFQDGNNTDNVGAWVVGATGWTIPGPNAADQGLQLTEGIVLGTAHSYTAGTDAAFRLRAAFYVPTVAQIAGLLAGFRVLGAYAVADDATEIAAAYDDKVVAGILGTGGASRLMTSVATTDVSTACTHTAITDGKLIAVEVNVDAAGLTTHKFATATPAGATAAQMRAAVTSAYTALDSDTDLLCDAKAVTLTAGEYVPTIMWAAAAGVSTVKLVDYQVGPLTTF